MTTMNEKLLNVWNEWEASTGENANNPDDFIDWAIASKRLTPRPEDLRKIFRRQVSTALRQSLRVDDTGTTYRTKQCVSILENGVQRTLWFDTDSGGTPQLRRKAAKQRRDSIANDVYRAMSDVEHMNHQYPEDEHIQFVLDFTEDYNERKSLEMLDRDGDIAC